MALMKAVVAVTLEAGSWEQQSEQQSTSPRRRHTRLLVESIARASRNACSAIIYWPPLRRTRAFIKKELHNTLEDLKSTNCSCMLLFINDRNIYRAWFTDTVDGKQRELHLEFQHRFCHELVNCRDLLCHNALLGTLKEIRNFIKSFHVKKICLA